MCVRVCVCVCICVTVTSSRWQQEATWLQQETRVTAFPYEEAPCFVAGRYPDAYENHSASAAVLLQRQVSLFGAGRTRTTESMRSTPRGLRRRMRLKPSSTTPPRRLKARTIDRHRTPSATFSSVAANTLEASHLDRGSRVGRLPEFPGMRSQSPRHRPMTPLRASLELFPAENLHLSQ